MGGLLFSRLCRQTLAARAPHPDPPRKGGGRKTTTIEDLIDGHLSMPVTQVENPGSPSRVGVSWTSGMVRLHDEDLFGGELGDLCVLFLRHVFGASEVTRVEIDRDQSTASIHYDAGALGLEHFLKRLAAALRGQLPPLAGLPSRFLSLDLAQSTGRVRIQRFGPTLTTWDIVHDRPGRISPPSRVDSRRHGSWRIDSKTSSRMSPG